MHDGREPPDVVLRWQVMIILVELTFLFAGLGPVPAAVEPAIFASP
jgi:hypothetical protein